MAHMRIAKHAKLNERWKNSQTDARQQMRCALFESEQFRSAKKFGVYVYAKPNTKLK